MTTNWKAGAARLPFPVPVGTPMAGYAARTGPSTGTLDELTIGALALEYDRNRLVLIAADLAAVRFLAGRRGRGRGRTGAVRAGHLRIAYP